MKLPPKFWYQCLTTVTVLLIGLGISLAALRHFYSFGLLRWDALNPKEGITTLRLYCTTNTNAPLSWRCVQTLPASRTWAFVALKGGPYWFCLTSFDGRLESAPSAVAEIVPRR